jgi:formate dehydrogenase (coenzyme F420) beta subunit
MQEELRQICRQLLADGTVQVVIGYGQATSEERVAPVFVTKPEDVERLVWNDQCFANLAKYLLRKEVRALGRAAICVKGCDQRALLVLEKESQIDRSLITVIGLACDGVGQPRQAKCESCDVHMPRQVDVAIGQAGTGPFFGQTTSTANNPLTENMDLSPSAAPADRRYAEIEAFLKKTPEERMAYWKAELSRCVKCYACRQVCPMCYCPQCIVDKNRPVAISTSATLKGNFAWQITRAFHLAGRCIGCDECTRACSAGIDLRLLNLSLAKAAEEHFGFRAGVDPAAEPIVGAYSEQDHEEFIR